MPQRLLLIKLMRSGRTTRTLTVGALGEGNMPMVGHIAQTGQVVVVDFR